MIYVDDDAAGANDGTSWEDAFSDLQDGLAGAIEGDRVLVAQGTYRPDRGSGDRVASFELKEGVRVEGGYAGVGALRPDTRDIYGCASILSGDLNGDDGQDFGNYGENSYHVVTAGRVGESAVLDGFTIRGGNADGEYPYCRGGGFYTYAGSPTVLNCTLVANAARGRSTGGAGLWNYEGNPVISDCRFVGNVTELSGAEWGEASGGGMYNYEGSPRLTRCAFLGNSAVGANGRGGGFFSYEGDPTVEGCLFAGNAASRKGGGMWNYSGNPKILNCTFSGNEGGGLWNYEGSPAVVNSILWGNGDSQISSHFGGLVVRYSDVQGGWPGEGNLAADPLFVDSGGGDYHVLAESPCVNGGDNSAVPEWATADLDGGPRILDGVVDMGCYERKGPRLIYVDDDAAGANDGTSWEDAFSDLQDGLAGAMEGDRVLVAQGTYRPDRGSGDRVASFVLKDGVRVEGGYAGVGALRPDTRDIYGCASILSGDLNGDDGREFGNYGENSYHVVVAEGVGQRTVLDGVVITAGCADEEDIHDIGAGMRCIEASPTLIGCTFRRNKATNFAGGLYNRHGNPKLTNCAFVQNRGGGMYNSGSPMLFSCKFLENISSGRGGGLSNSGSPTLVNCVFMWNSDHGGTVNDGGGGMYNYGEAVLVNCLFVGNSADHRGGAIWFWGSSASLLNCTFFGNEAAKGDALAFDSHNQREPSDVDIVNCILWNGPAGIWNNDASEIVIAYSDVEGGWPGAGNIAADPRFVDSGDGDFRLRADSPCINAGHNAALPASATTDLDGGPRISGDVVDMGCYERKGPRVIYVDDDARGANDGSSWEDAFRHLQNGLAAASAGDEIRVAAGVYRPDRGAGVSKGDRMATFRLKDGVAVKGGYVDVDGQIPCSRADALLQSILSGDLAGNDGEITDPCELPGAERRAENSFHVVTALGAGRTAVLDNFVVTGGNANGPEAARQNCGGGFYHDSDSRATIKGCIFARNSASGEGQGGGPYDDGGCGGGFYDDGGQPLLTGCIFIHNSADGYGAGGGMFTFRGEPVLEECVFRGNVIVGYGCGGGFENDGGSPVLRNCTFSDNSASRGGGLYGGNHGSTTLEVCTFKANKAGHSGGGILHASGNLDVSGCKFLSNVSSGYGGGLVSGTHNSTVIESAFIENTAAEDAGGMFVGEDTIATMERCQFVRNTAGRHGGAVANGDVGSVVTLVECTFTANTAGENGGAVLSFHNTIDMQDCAFEGNKASKFGGGVFNDRIDGGSFKKCVFDGCRAGVRGGGLYTHQSSPAITECLFRENVGEDGGGGMYNYGGNPVLTDCRFVGNSVLDGGGGGMGSVGDPVVTGCDFIENSAAWESGGAINCSGSPTLVNCIFRGNSGARGGAFHEKDPGGKPRLYNCLFVGNKASEWCGGLCSNSSEVTLTNCTFAANRAPAGGAFGCRSANNRPSSKVKATNCIIWNGDDPIWNDDGSEIVVSFSDVQGGWRGEGNIDAEPLFVDAEGGNYRIGRGSPCIDAGSNRAVPDTLERDLDGNQRIFGGVVDMGCYEYAGPRVVYVDRDARGANNGSSWEDAYRHLQNALSAASAGCEIRVAGGTYRPDHGSGDMMRRGDREATFKLKSGVRLEGGYAGCGADRPDARDVERHETILSGDLAGNDTGDLLNESRAENSFHVVTGGGTDETAVLDGFTITGGNAYNDRCSSFDNGGGMYNVEGSPTVVNCTFRRNTASDQCGGGGGAMYNRAGSPTVTACRFIGNGYIISDDDGGGAICNYESGAVVTDCEFRENTSNGYGGAVLNRRSEAVLSGCIFANNSSEHAGGAVINRASNAVIRNCVFVENRAWLWGGAIQNEDRSKPKLIGCVFTGNRVTDGQSQGGGVCSQYGDRPVLVNCVFSGNRAWQGGGMYGYGGSAELLNCTFSGNRAVRGGGLYCRMEDTKLWNCIVRGNTAEKGSELYFAYFEKEATLEIGYTDIRRSENHVAFEPFNTLIWGEGNIDEDPMFAAPGHWTDGGEWVDGDYRLSAGSPCINAGDPASEFEADATDAAGMPRVIGERVEMGAYEFNHRPVADAGRDRTVAVGPGGKAKVRLDGTGSYDADGQELTYRWRWRVGERDFAATGGDGIINMLDFAAIAGRWLDAEAPARSALMRDGGADVEEPGIAALTDAWLSTPESANWNPRLDVAPEGARPVIELPVGRHVIQLIVSDGYEDSEPDEVVITVVAPMEAELEVLPEEIWRSDPRQPDVLAIVDLPPGVGKEQVNGDKPLVMSPGTVEAVEQYVFQTTEWGRVRTTIYAFFEKARLMRAIRENGPVVLGVTGELKNGRPFYGVDVVTIRER